MYGDNGLFGWDSETGLIVIGKTTDKYRARI